MIEFLTENSIYLVFIITLVIWLGIGYFLFNFDNKLKKLEQDFNNFKKEQS